MTIELKALAAEILEARGGHGGRCRVPDSLRRKVIDAVWAHEAAGGGVNKGVELLGLDSASFYRWLRELGMFDAWCRRQVPKRAVTTRASAKLVPVRVVEPTVVTTSIVVMTPRGLRIEGLDVDSLSALVARCG